MISDAPSGIRVPALLDAGEAFDLARLMIQAHITAFHGGVLDDGCPECSRLEAHEDGAAFAFGMSVDPFSATA